MYFNRPSSLTSPTLPPSCEIGLNLVPVDICVYKIAVSHLMVRDRAQWYVLVFILLVDGFCVSGVENNYGNKMRCDSVYLSQHL